MTRTRLTGKASALALILAGCTPAQAPISDTTSRGDFTAELISSPDETPPPGPADVCWARDDIPAVIETVTEQTVLTPEIRDETGAVIQPTVFSSKVDQRVIHDGDRVWFQIPCQEVITEDFVASLQRALKARGLYLEAVTGQMDVATLASVRAFQAGRGIDSDILSARAARELGLIEVLRTDL
jgi:hypothetical protein